MTIVSGFAAAIMVAAAALGALDAHLYEYGQDGCQINYNFRAPCKNSTN
jgi:hypothetical protein